MTVFAAAERRAITRTSADFQSAELLALASLLIFYGLIAALLGRDGVAFANRAGPVALFAILGYGAWNIARRDRAALWTPLFWLRVSTAIYFGLGGLVPYIANEATFQYMQSLYPFTPEEALKLHTLVALGMLSALAASAAFDWLWPRRPIEGDALAGLHDSKNVLAAGLGFLAIGAAYKYLVLLPQALGILTVTLPGMFGSLVSCGYVGVFLIFAWAAHHARLAWLPLLLFLSVELVTALLTFSKQQVLFTLLMACLGLLTRGVTPLRVAPLLASMVFTYMLLHPLVGHGRSEQYARLGSLSAPASLEQRTEFLLSYFDNAKTPAESSVAIQGWLSRLSYVNAGAFVIAQHDSGSPGNSFRYAAYSLVPRMIWPDKPITTNIGRELAELASGYRSENSIAAGWFAEAYWNYGWFGVPLLMAPLGVLFAMLSRYAAGVLRRGEWLALPIVFLGLRMGGRVDGAFVVDVVGATTILVAYLALITMVRLVVPAHTPVPAPRLRRRTPVRL